MLVFGHVLDHAPQERHHYETGLWRNTAALLRLFLARPVPNAPVRLHFGTDWIDGQADDQGFFTFEWQKDRRLDEGWHDITVEVTGGPAAGTWGHGKLYHPFPTKRAYVSDIDDTFLVSYSADLLRRLRELFTRNPRTRQPFEGVVAHYQALAVGNATEAAPNPFFYVSSSEWNLYDYIKEFCRFHGLPEGVFLLSALKRLSSFWKTGQGTHSQKYDRIARIFRKYPHMQFGLLGDDTQQDPDIYARLVADFPGQVLVLYLRRRVPDHAPRVETCVRQIEQAGVPVCYFEHSDEALRHSRHLGLVNTGH